MGAYNQPHHMMQKAQGSSAIRLRGYDNLNAMSDYKGGDLDDDDDEQSHDEDEDDDQDD